jgi:hypothetical protein
VAAAVVVLDLDLAVAVLLADVASRVVSAVAGERRRGGAHEERAGDHGGGGDATKIHLDPPD